MLIILFLVLFSLSPTLQANALEVVFEHNPPFQMIDGGQNGYGPVFEFANKLIKYADIQAHFNGKPWARIIRKEAFLPNKLILSMSKTPQRTPKFIWLISVYEGQQYIWKKKNAIDPHNKKLTVSLERDSHKIKSINAYFKPENVFKFLNSAQALDALMQERVQRFVGTTFAVSGKLASLGYTLADVEQMSVFDEGHLASQGLYLALTLGTDSQIIEALESALQHPEIIKARNSLFNNFLEAEKKLLAIQSR
ncbi:substrate-binding periplasmic protein [Colwelliaceae bacterium 6441]